MSSSKFWHRNILIYKANKLFHFKNQIEWKLSPIHLKGSDWTTYL